MKQLHTSFTPEAKSVKPASPPGTCTVALKLDASGNPLPLVKLLPLGYFRARDGRPAADYPGLTEWQCNESIAQALIARFSAEGMPLLLDYEHQTMLAEENGQPAPASGWGRNLQLLDDGLYAEVEWTERAKAMIRAGEYKFISPVFTFDAKTGAVLKLLHAALTNYPALTDMRPVAAKHNALIQDSSMSLKPETIAMLGLAMTASMDDVHTAVVNLKAKAETTPTPNTPDPAQFVPVAALEAVKQQLAVLTARQQQAEVDTLIEEGKSAGKLLPAQEQWARNLGGKDVSALRAYLDSTPVIAALKGGTQTQGKAPADDSSAALTSEQREAIRLGDWDEKVFKGGAN